jgi:hypothetical protein
MTELEPRRGAIALCTRGALGLITCDEAQEVTYNDGNKGVSWTGIQLTNTTIQGMGKDEGKTFDVKIGSPWSSRTPKVIAYIENFIDIINVESNKQKI